MQRPLVAASSIMPPLPAAYICRLLLKSSNNSSQLKAAGQSALAIYNNKMGLSANKNNRIDHAKQIGLSYFEAAL
jgi:hypothetical protein